MKHKQLEFCSNVKILVTLSSETTFEIKDCDLLHETPKNVVIRASDFTIIRYRHCLNSLHITGIYNFEKIPELLKFLSERTFIPSSLLAKKVVINNSSWHMNLKEQINLKKLAEKLLVLKSKDFTWKFNTLKFPGLCIKWTEGCAILFNSGKINILGIKSKQCFFRIKIKILDIIYASNLE